MERVHDAWRFWRRSFGRGLLLLSSCSLIVALAAVNTVVLRSSLWFTPPGVTADKSFVTLGQRTPEGRFEPVALRDLDRLGAWFARDSYAAYGTADADIRFGGRAWPAPGRTWPRPGWTAPGCDPRPEAAPRRPR